MIMVFGFVATVFLTLLWNFGYMDGTEGFVRTALVFILIIMSLGLQTINDTLKGKK